MSQHDNSSEFQYNKVPTKEIINEKLQVPLKYGYGVRHVQLILIFICVTVSFVARGHLGVTVVAMTSHDNDTNTTLNTSLSVHVTEMNYNGEINNTQKWNNEVNVTVAKYRDISNGSKSIAKEDGVKTFHWPKSTQEMVLGSFFVGYCIMAFPIGLVVQRWGGKLPMQISLLVSGVMSILTPWLTFWGGWKAVCFSRVLQGLSQAGVYPSLQSMLSNWAPISERASLSSYVYTGTTIGTVIGFQMAGFLAESRWGWPSTWWAVGGICLLSFAALTFFGAASPRQHSGISDEEKDYILGKADDGVVRPRPKTPWKSISRSKHVWGVWATHVGSGVAFNFCFTQVPSFIHYILGVDVKSSGVLSSLPYIFSFFTSITFGLVSDFCTNRKLLSLQNARRILNSISQVGIAVSLVCVSFTKSTLVAVACLIVAIGCHMGIHSGWIVNHIDLSPNFSGALMAVGNTFMNMVSVLLPLMVSHIVTDVTNQNQWRIMFFIIAGLAFTCNAIFVLLMSSDTQPWNDVDTNDTPLEETKLQDTKPAIRKE